METTGTKSDKVKYVLRWLDPFPTDIKVVDVKQSGDKLAYATLAEEAGPLQIQGDFSDWRVDPRACRPLFRSVGAQVELRREGNQWKIYLPVTPDLRLCVDYLAENGSNYANAVDRVKEDLKNDATTKESLENALKQALEESK